ncbi:MAG: low-complexity tail membrane protein [Cyanobacteria bacterium J06649_4]
MQQNRYLWVHFAGLALVPLLLDACLAGLASAGPALPYGGQFWAIALISIPPSLAMQWLKPFYVFSLPPLALKPDALSEDQRRCLGIFQSWQIKAIAGLTAGFAFWLLVQLYLRSTQITPVFTPLGGWAVAAIAFFLVCTVLQISMASGRALLVSQSTLQRVPAVDTGEIPNKFLILGFGLRKLLPEGQPLEQTKPISDTPPQRNPNQDSSKPIEKQATPEESESKEPAPEEPALEEPTIKATVAEPHAPPVVDLTAASSTSTEVDLSKPTNASTPTAQDTMGDQPNNAKDQPIDRSVQSP